MGFYHDGLDPHAKLIEEARKNAEDVDFGVDFLVEGAEDTSLGDASVDTVLTSFVYCTIPDLAGALAEIRRVLRPGGRVLFAEHGLAPEPWRSGSSDWRSPSTSGSSRAAT